LTNATKLHIIFNMKIAFLGKGGSGKSTVSSLFSLFLLKEKNKIALFDADINIHVEKLFNIKLEKEKYLSFKNNPLKIRKYLRGNNQLIKDEKHFVKTTPPGKGSNFFEINEENYIVKNFGLKINDNFFLFNVGTYESEGKGLSCYHTNLSIFENIISHSLLKEKDYLVADMVAGIDSLANSLYIQFDVLFFIVEPTPESVAVFNDFYFKINNENLVVPIANKIEIKDDLIFLKESLHIPPKFFLDYKKEIKKIRQNKIDLLSLNNIFFEQSFYEIYSYLKTINTDPNLKLKQLINLHKKYVQLDYVKRAYGDLSHQIDDDFNF